MPVRCASCGLLIDFWPLGMSWCRECHVLVCMHCRGPWRSHSRPPCPVCHTDKYGLEFGGAYQSFMITSVVASPLIIIFLAGAILNGLRFFTQSKDGWFLAALLLMTWVPALILSGVFEYFRRSSERAIANIPSLATRQSIGEYTPKQGAMTFKNTAIRSLSIRIVALVFVIGFIAVMMIQVISRILGDIGAMAFMLLAFILIFSGISLAFSLRIYLHTPARFQIDNEGFRAVFPLGYSLGSKWTDIQWIGTLNGGFLTDADLSSDYRHMSLNLKGVRLVTLGNLTGELFERINTGWSAKKSQKEERPTSPSSS